MYSTLVCEFVLSNVSAKSGYQTDLVDARTLVQTTVFLVPRTRDRSVTASRRGFNERGQWFLVAKNMQNYVTRWICNIVPKPSEKSFLTHKFESSNQNMFARFFLLS